MKNSLFIIIVACALATAGACLIYRYHTNTLKENIKYLMATKPDISSLKQLNPSDYTIIRYAKPVSCTSCHLQTGQWKVYQRKMMKTFGNKLQFHHIIDTKNPDEVRRICGTRQFDGIITIDTLGSFISSNPQISPFGNDVVMLLDKNMNDVVMLLDKNMSVIATGNPCKNEQAAELYNHLISSGATSDLK